MAAITPSSSFYNVVGKLRSQLYTISGSSGDTLVVGMNIVNAINGLGGLITSYTQVNASPNPGQTTITFTSSAPFTNQQIEVLGN